MQRFCFARVPETVSNGRLVRLESESKATDAFGVGAHLVISKFSPQFFDRSLEGRAGGLDVLDGDALNRPS